MAADVSLPVLLAPLIIAGMAVAFMILFSGGREGRQANGAKSADQTLGYKVDAKTSVSLTPARYVGGHPDQAQPIAQPFLLLTERDLALYRRKGMPVSFTVAWAKVDQITRLNGEQMAMAAASVRGLVPGAIEDLAADAAFARVRFEDERGWWQNVVFELAPTYADQQFEEIEGNWRLAQAHAEQTPNP